MKRNFIFLNAAQFLDAVNENFFRYIVVFFLIFYKGGENAADIMSFTGAILVIPFILFSSFGGVFADLYSKTSSIRITRVFQVLGMLLGLIMVLFPSGNWIYVPLFVISTLSALFVPSKYGIIPELVEEHKLVRANAYVSAFTYWGIIFGTGLASLLHSLFPNHFVLMLLVGLSLSLIGLFCSFCIEVLPPAHPEKKWPHFIYQEIFDAFKDMSEKPLFITVVVYYSYFLFIGAFVQMNIVPFAISTLQLDAGAGGYLFLFAAIGIGIGSMIAAKLSASLKPLPLYGVGMTIMCLLFTFFPNPFWINVFWLIGLGILAGLYLVPLQTFILVKSAPENKGRNFATANLCTFVAALFAALVLFLLTTFFDMKPTWGFFWVAIFNLGMSLFLFKKIRSAQTY